jgi:WD40 repeat protein
LWNAQGSFLTAFEGHAGPLLSASFNLDGSRIATAGEDGIARMWKIYTSVDEMLAEATNRLTRSLTDAECKQYLHVDECPITPSEYKYSFDYPK